ncbi:GNAT family N-acetyltransferase [Pseudoteredinibacter isoporae]|uniref:GNAT family N-acetyltransferase n=1 Tax=Pseudoteredinibacter isoporae TaxID=570281 RepID=UPI00310978D3
MSIQVRALSKDDFDQWKALFKGYCDFYDSPADQEKVMTEWNWLHDETNMLQGLVACDEHGDLAGLAHYHAWPLSIYGKEVCYLSDLFVSTSFRGKGVGKTLYQYLMAVCKEQGWPALTLLTQDGNSTARSLYDQYAEASDFRFYITPA